MGFPGARPSRCPGPVYSAGMKFLAISGSLRTASNNTALLRAMARLAPTGTEVCLYEGLGQLPLFNPDLETADPAPVARLRNELIEADAVIIASPEYAHGITGVLKNALDWMVGCEAFVYKPVALINASPRAVHAHAALREVVGVMSALVVEEASVTLPILGSGLDEHGMAAHPELSRRMADVLCSLAEAVRRHGTQGVTP